MQLWLADQRQSCSRGFGYSQVCKCLVCTRVHYDSADSGNCSADTHTCVETQEEDGQALCWSAFYDAHLESQKERVLHAQSSVNSGI
jgi:hypothetical protein